MSRVTAQLESRRKRRTMDPTFIRSNIHCFLHPRWTTGFSSDIEVARQSCGIGGMVLVKRAVGEYARAVGWA